MVSAVACSRNGRVFLAANQTITIYQVASLYDCLHERVEWHEISKIEVSGVVHAVACSPDASKVLIASGSSQLELYQVVKKNKSFVLGDDDHHDKEAEKEEWYASQGVKLDNVITKLAFSPDCSYFVSMSKNEPIVKVWYKNTKDCDVLSSNAPHSFTYLPHPSPIVSFSWRENAANVFESSFSNTLLTICADRVCRIWLEMTMTTNESSNDLFETFHQFHLVASISPFADLPSPILADYLKANPKTPFCCFWLNNKNMGVLQVLDRVVQQSQRKRAASKATITSNVGKTTNEMHESTTMERVFKVGIDEAEEEDDDELEEILPGGTVNTGFESDTEEGGLKSPPIAAASLPNFRKLVRRKYSKAVDKLSTMQFALLRREWIHSPDMVAAFSPADGSFLLWVVEHLDKAHDARFVQPSVTFTSCLPATLPVSDAISLVPKPILLYNDTHGPATLVTIHDNGSLNKWSLALSEKMKHSTVVSIFHGQRICGHRTSIESICVHPLLPVVVTQAPGELVFWKVSPTTQLHQSGGFSEVTRMPLYEEGNKAAWIPSIYPGSYSPCGTSPSTLFMIRSAKGQVTAFQVILDAYTLFLRLKKRASSNANNQIDHKLPIVSQQSASRPACVLRIASIDNTCEDECRFFHVFPISAFPLAQMANRSSEVTNDFIAVSLLVSRNGDTFIKSSLISVGSVISKPASTDGISNAPSPIEQINSIVTYPKVHLTIEPLSCINLNLPHNVSVSCVDSSISQPSSAFLSNLGAPYQIATGCSDGVIRFWQGHRPSRLELKWAEWTLPGSESKSSSVKPNFFMQNPNAKMLAVSCAFSCRFAVGCVKSNPALAAPAFQFTETNGSIISPSDSPPVPKRTAMTRASQILPPALTCQIAVYECESSGGYDWTLEDTLDLGNEMPFMPAVGDQKDAMSAIKVTWSPVHDGSHLLAVLFVNQVYIYAQISTEIASVTFKVFVLLLLTSIFEFVCKFGNVLLFCNSFYFLSLIY